MFGALLALLLVAATVHAWRSKERSMQRVGEIFLVYVLVGYCGIPMVIIGAGALLGFDLRGGMPVEVPASNIFLQFAAVMLASMGISALAGSYFRGVYLVGPAIVWIFYFAGATFVHLAAGSEAVNMGHGDVLTLFATHGLISVILVIALFMSGLLSRAQSPA